MPPPSAPRTTIEGTVERLTFANEDTRYVVFRLKEGDKAGLTTVVGKLWPIAQGENLRVRGRWVTHKKFGDQFAAEHCESTVPSTLDGIELYLGSGMISGIGPVMAKRLVAAFGEATLDVITDHPHRLAEVEGIGPKRRTQIATAWQEQQGIREVMVFLQGHGVNPGHAARIYKLYGTQAMHLVKRDPYRLVTDVHGIGFKTADAIAERLGVSHDAPERRCAGLVHTLVTAADQGHTHVREDDLLEATRALLGEDSGDARPELDGLVEEQRIMREGTGGTFSGERRCYLPDLHAAEVRVTHALEVLACGRSRLPQIKVERAIEWFEEKQHLTLTEAQRDCVRRVATDKVLVITGGPGTGKTTILRAVCAIYQAKQMTVVLAAPTGRAANRMSDVTGLPAQTLHRLLEFNPRAGGFMRNLDHPLVGDLFIVDEVSMVDLALAAALFEALPPHAALVLVGDADQLPSVGPGQILRDLLDSGALPVVRLTEIMRQKAESAIVLHAHTMQQGHVPAIHALDDAGSGIDCLWITEGDPEAVVRIIKDLHTRYVPERLGCDPVEDVQVLCPVHKGVVGVANLNAQLQALLNPEGRMVQRGDRLFREGDKVLQLRNNYDKGVFNGDLGRVVEARPNTNELRVAFDQDTVLYEAADLDELTLGYAITVHKAQGSEYPAVILPVLTQHFILLDRNLLYTGLTRGRRLVVLVGTQRALEMAVSRRRAHERASSLIARLAGTLEDAIEPIRVNQLHLPRV